MTAPPLLVLGRSGLAAPIIGFGVSGPLGLPLVSASTVASLVDVMLEGALPSLTPRRCITPRRIALAERSQVSPRRLWSRKWERSGTTSGRIVEDYSVKGFVSQVDASCRALQRDRIDLLQLHGAPPEIAADPAVRRVFDRLKSSGASGLAGAALCNPEEFTAFVSLEWIDVITAPLAGGLSSIDLKEPQRPARAFWSSRPCAASARPGGCGRRRIFGIWLASSATGTKSPSPQSLRRMRSRALRRGPASRRSSQPVCGFSTSARTWLWRRP